MREARAGRGIAADGDLSGARVERSLLSDDVEGEAWYVDETWSPEVQKEALEVDAMEAVANELLEVLRAMGDAI